MEILKDLEKTNAWLRALDAEYKNSINLLQECEAIENDIRHALELGDLKYADRAKLTTKLTKILKERRIHKDSIEIMKPLIHLLKEESSKSFINKLSKILGETRKISRSHESRQYFPRTNAVETILKAGENT